MRVFLFVPNLIGYLRLSLLLLSALSFGSRPSLFGFCYFFALFLDYIDGWAARKLQQTSKFGELLDQVTDRTSSLALAFMVFQRRPVLPLRGLFLFFVLIDLWSHWFHTFAAVAYGKYHKQFDSKYRLLTLYYTRWEVMDSLIVGVEVFMVSYVWVFVHGWRGVAGWLLGVSFLFFVGKTVINVMQLVNAGKLLQDFDKWSGKRQLQTKDK